MLLTCSEARRTFKAVLSAPKIVPPPGAETEEGKPDADGDVAMAEAAESATEAGSPAKAGKRSAGEDAASSKKKVKAK